MQKIRIELELEKETIEQLDELRNEFRKVSRATMVEILINNATPQRRKISKPQAFRQGPQLDEPSDW